MRRALLFTAVVANATLRSLRLCANILNAARAAHSTLNSLSSAGGAVCDGWVAGQLAVAIRFFARRGAEDAEIALGGRSPLPMRRALLFTAVVANATLRSLRLCANILNAARAAQSTLNNPGGAGGAVRDGRVAGQLAPTIRFFARRGAEDAETALGGCSPLPTQRALLFTAVVANATLRSLRLCANIFNDARAAQSTNSLGSAGGTVRDGWVAGQLAVAIRFFARRGAEDAETALGGRSPPPMQRALLFTAVVVYATLRPLRLCANILESDDIRLTHILS